MSKAKPTLQDALLGQQSDYLAAKRHSRMRRRRRGIPSFGASGDFHYRNEADYLWMGEFARDIDRNDVIVGQTIDRAVDNTLQGGLEPEPNTGDTGADQALKDRWAEESIDPRCCDLAGQLNFFEQTKVVLRDTLVAGDIFALPHHDGPVQLMEFHRCRSPKRTKKNIVHGIEMTPERKRIRYWFTREPVDPNKQQSLRLKDLAGIPAFDADGDPNVWHMYRPKRATQTRGVTALAPIFDMAGMHDDIQFAELLHRQVASCFFFFRNRSSEFDWNSNSVQQAIGQTLPAAGTTRRIEGTVPGMEFAGAAGEKVTMDSPKIPNSTYFPHIRQVVTYIGINLGVPLVMVLMDASETNFSGYRGAIDQARLGFRCNQRALVSRWARPNWHWRVHRWAEDDRALREIAESNSKVSLTRHTWKLPAWPYIEPTKDAAADLMRLSNLLTSPRRQQAERGEDFMTMATETVEDRREVIQLALKEAGKLNDEFELEGEAAVSWRDLAPLPTPEGVQVSITAGGEDSAKQTKQTNEDRE